MTSVEPVTGSAVVPYTGDMAGLGLEDVTAADLSIPRLNIVGKTATFQNSQTKEEFSEISCILICQVKQRVMWNAKPHKDYKYPQCRSTDFVTGFPNVDPKAPSSDGGYNFPWSEGNFDPPSGQQGLYIPEVLNQTGLPALPCDKCKFKEWEGGKTRCREQHVYPLLYQSGDLWVPAVLTIQGSGIVPSRTYIGGFATSRQPLFTVVTRIRLKGAQRGSVDYAIPEFSKVGGSDPNMYEEYATQVGVMRAYLRRWPTARDEIEATEAEAPANINSGPIIEHVPAPPVAAEPEPASASAAATVPIPDAAPATPPTPPAAAPSLPPPPAPSLPEPTPVQPATAEPAPPPGYEAIWATMPGAAKEAVLAAMSVPVASASLPATPAPTAQPATAPAITSPAVSAPNPTEDLPF